jgi:uncharacterized protein (TIGR03067 family)
MAGKFLLLVSIGLLLLAPLNRPVAANGPTGIEGKWILESGELGGEKLPDEGFKGTVLVMADGHYDYQNDHGTITLLPDHTPPAMDITGTDGPNKGKTFPAIYELEGDTLRICYDLTGKQRPSEFRTQAGTDQFLTIYKKAKPETAAR